MKPLYRCLYITLPPQHCHWPFVNLLLFNTFFSAQSFSISEWAFYLSSTNYFCIHLFVQQIFLDYLLGAGSMINCWSCSGIFLVALVYFPPFLISCLSLLYSIGNKVKKDFQGVTLKGSQKLSTNPFTLPMKTQVCRASMWLSLVLIKTYSSPSSPCFNLSTRYIIDNKCNLHICIILWLSFLVCKMGIVLLLTSYSSCEN